MAATKKQRKKKKRPRFTWEQSHSLKLPAHPVYVDLDGMLKAIDAGSGSEEEKRAEKEITTYLAFFADKNGEVRLDDEIISFNSSLLKRE